MSQDQHQQEAPEQSPGMPRHLLQRGHSGEGAHSALELLRKRRDLESLGDHRTHTGRDAGRDGNS